jgi:hypothetical protein
MGMRYHFHIRDTEGLIPDEEGSELANLDAARAEARASAHDLVANDLRSGRTTPERQIEIADARGAVLDFVRVAVIVN